MTGTIRHFPVNPGNLGWSHKGIVSHINNTPTPVAPAFMETDIRGSSSQNDWSISTSISGTQVVISSIDTASNDYKKWHPKPQQTAMTQLPRLPTILPRSHGDNHVNMH